MRKIAMYTTLTILLLTLAGCGEVMESTSNLINAVEKKIETDDTQINEEESEQVIRSTVATEELEVNIQDVASIQSTKEVLKPVSTNIVEKDTSNMSHVQVTAKDANIRVEPSLNSKVILASKLNDTFIYLSEKVKTSDGRTWYKVDTSEGIGYMSSAVGTLTNEQQANNGVKISNAVGSSTLIVRAEEGGNVRAKPSIDSKVIATVKGGDVLSYNGETIKTSDERVWHEIVIDGSIGYISNLIAIDSDEYEKGNDGYRFAITSAEGNVRAEPSINASIIYTGKKGSTFFTYMETVKTSDGRTWYGVETDNGYGYISSKVGIIR